MSSGFTRPPFDPELQPALALLSQSMAHTLTPETIGQARQTPMTPPPLEQFTGRELEWYDVTIPGHLGDDIVVTVLRKRGPTGVGPGIFHTHGGGMIVGEGTPEDIVAIPGSHTGHYLAPLLRRRRAAAE